MNRRLPDLKTAVEASGLTNGCRISFHHHLRLGDSVVEQVLSVLEEMGFQQLTLCASSLMGSACQAVLKGIKCGLISRIETTGMKEPLSSAVLLGQVPEPVIFRSHGARARTILEGRTPIHTAFLAVSLADEQGNANGTGGHNRFGSLGYALPDAAAAENVVLITDTLAEKTLPPSESSIRGNERCMVVKVNSIGERKKIAGGSLRQSHRPVDKITAQRAFEVIQASELIVPGFSYQAGSGSISLLVSNLMGQYQRKKNIRGAFALGGITGPLVKLLEEGLFERLYDVQSFDDEAVCSLARNDNHIEISADLYANPARLNCLAHQLDVMILSATEVDCDFNLNSITGTNGRILGALGGAPDTAEGARLTIVVIPSFRGRIPAINRKVNLICTPGRFIDVIVTEKGIAVNPGRRELEKKLNTAGVKTQPVETLMNKVYKLTGVPSLPEYQGRVVGLVEDRQGNIQDRILLSEHLPEQMP